MPISTVSLSNTFFQWIIVTNSLVNQVNTLESGDYTKSNGTIYLTSSGTGLHSVSNSNFLGFTRFFNDTQFDKNIVANNLSLSGTALISGIQFSNNKITLRTFTTPSNTSIVINRGEALNANNANAELRWNETSKYWDIRNINDPTTYNKIILNSDIANTTQYGITALNNDINSANTLLAATPNTVNIVYNISKNAFTQANTANNNAINAFGQANAAYARANTNSPLGAFTQANTANNNAINAYGQANAAYLRANTNSPLGAFTQANTAVTTATLAFAQSNTSFTLANNAGFITSTTTTNKTLIKRERCCVTTNNVVLTLPASPNDSTQTDDWVVIVSVGNFTNTTILRNGSNIETQADDLTIDIANTTQMFTYINSTVGWKT